MLSLGLDPSLRAYGWAVHDSSASGLPRRVASGHEGTLSSSVPVARFMHFRAMVADLLDRHPGVSVVGIESPAYEAGPFQSIHFGLMMYSLEAVFERRKDVVLYDPTTLKYMAKGDPSQRKGPMHKMDMQRVVQLDTMDTRVIDNNEADAYLVALFAARFAAVNAGSVDPSALTPAEHAVFVGRKRTVKRGKARAVKRVAHAFRPNSRFFEFSKVPAGSVTLPKKAINQSLLEYIEGLEAEEAVKP